MSTPDLVQVAPVVLTADIIAKAVVGAARAFGDDPAAAITHRSLAAAAEGLSRATGVPVDRLCAMLQIGANNMRRSAAARGFEAAALSAEHAVRALAAGKPEPAPPASAPDLKHGMKRGGRKAQPADKLREPAVSGGAPPSQAVARAAEAATGDSPVASAPTIAARSSTQPPRQLQTDYVAPPAPQPGPRLVHPAPARPYNPVSPRKLRFAGWFLDAKWPLAQVADLFDVEPADLREALGAAA